MSVIPLIPGRSVVFTQEAYQAADGADGTAIWILNCDTAQLLGDVVPVSYDLRVGGEYRDHRSKEGRQIVEDDEVVLLPGMAVIIQTEERVQFPRFAFGAIVPKVSLLQKGLSNTTSKVDPGYGGHLLVTAFNLGRNTVRLRKGDPFCCLYVLRVGEGAGLYPHPEKRILNFRAKRWYDSWAYAIEARRGLLTVLLLGATLLLIGINVLQLITRSR